MSKPDPPRWLRRRYPVPPALLGFLYRLMTTTFLERWNEARKDAA